MAAASDKLYVNFGKEILKIVKGRVSTEIAANLSFDVESTVAKARSIIALYEKEGMCVSVFSLTRNCKQC